jgi:hypothetical protein
MEWLLGALAAVAVLALIIWLLLPWLTRPLSSSRHHSSQSAPETGYSVWSYQGGTWRLFEDRSAPGFVPGPPPAEPGLHEGYCVKVISVRRPEAR